MQECAIGCGVLSLSAGKLLSSLHNIVTKFPAGGSSCSDQLTMLITIADSCWTKLKCCGTDPIAVDTVESRQYNFYTVIGAMISRW